MTVQMYLLHGIAILMATVRIPSYEKKFDDDFNIKPFLC